MTAYKNLAFGLEVRRLPRAEIDRRVHEIARLLNLQDRLSVPASRLGVNEMQRLGLGRSAKPTGRRRWTSPKAAP